MRREGLWASPACAQLLSFHGINWLNELLPVFTHPTVAFPDQVFPDVYFQTNAKCSFSKEAPAPLTARCAQRATAANEATFMVAVA